MSINARDTGMRDNIFNSKKNLAESLYVIKSMNEAFLHLV